MTIFMHATLPGVTPAQYDALNAELRSLPGDTFAGCLAHTCVPSGEGLDIYDVWESEEAMDAFAAAMMPVAEKHGMPAGPGRPVVREAHNFWIPGSS